MRTFIVAAGLGLAMLFAPPAHARGCLKGAAVGGVAGHFAGHHGVLGAAAGCAVGHHMANRQEQQQQRINGSPSQSDLQGPPSH